MNSIMWKSRKITRNISTALSTDAKQSEENEMMLYIEINSINIDINAVICGDFNSPSVNWSTVKGDREGRILIGVAEDTFFVAGGSKVHSRQ